MRAAPPEACGGAWAYLQLIDQHHLALEAMATVATALDRVLEADGQTPIRQVIEAPETFREAVDQLDAYLRLHPEHFDRHVVTAQLRALIQQKGTSP